MFDQREYRIEVDGKRTSPLIVSHLVNGCIFGRPDAVVGYKNVETSKSLDGGSYQLLRGCGPIEVTPHGRAVGFAALVDQRPGRRLSLLVIEQHARASFHEQAHRSSSNAAR